MLRKTLQAVSVAGLIFAGFALSSAASATAAAPKALEAAHGTAVAAPTAVYGPYASYEVCWVVGNQGQQAGQWQSFFCSQNGTPNWWLFTAP